MTRDWFLARFAEYRARTEPARGDHDLNPGTAPKPPFRPAAVLVPLVDHDDGLTVLFTQRTDHLAYHPGQVSFPGGHVDPDDGDPTQHAAAINAAIREAEEEIGLEPARVQVIGRLDTYVTRTGFEVTPVVSLVTPGFTLAPDPTEVAEVFEVPLAFLLDPANHQRCSRVFEDREREFYAMPYGRHFIWGATAGMLKNLCDAVGQP